MGRRRLGRETAFKALYQIDATGAGIEDALANLFEGGPPDEEARRFAQDLLETIGEHRTAVDECLARVAENWDVARMAIVDRAILRLGIGEILYWPWIPNEVSINEYVEIAKKFSSEEAGGFVNAILDRVAHESEGAES